MLLKKNNKKKKKEKRAIKATFGVFSRNKIKQSRDVALHVRMYGHDTVCTMGKMSSNVDWSRRCKNDLLCNHSSEHCLPTIKQFLCDSQGVTALQ